MSRRRDSTFGGIRREHRLRGRACGGQRTLDAAATANRGRVVANEAEALQLI